MAAYGYNKDSMAGSEYANAKNWFIANNTLAFNKHASGVVLWQDGVENCIIQNNIFYKNGGPNGIVFYTQEGRRHLIRNNIFWSHTAKPRLRLCAPPPGASLASSEEDAYQTIDNQQLEPSFADSENKLNSPKSVNNLRLIPR